VAAATIGSNAHEPDGGPLPGDTRKNQRRPVGKVPEDELLGATELGPELKIAGSRIRNPAGRLAFGYQIARRFA
jgi:hypothetical protein